MKNVLFVDDEKSILTAIRRSFRKEDMGLYYASSAQEALEHMASVEIAVIVADIGMPDVDGVDLLKEVDKRWPATIKIALTGKNELEEVYDVFKAIDLYKYVTKPWVPGDLVTFVKEGFNLYTKNA